MQRIAGFKSRDKNRGKIFPGEVLAKELTALFGMRRLSYMVVVRFKKTTRFFRSQQMTFPEASSPCGEDYCWFSGRRRLPRGPDPSVGLRGRRVVWYKSRVYTGHKTCQGVFISSRFRATRIPARKLKPCRGRRTQGKPTRNAKPSTRPASLG